MIHRDEVILKEITEEYDIRGNSLSLPDRTIKVTYDFTNKLIKKAIDQGDFAFVEASIEIQTKEKLKIDDILVINEKQYKVISCEEVKSINKRIPSEWIYYAE